jgi:hypothetical protein
VKYHEPLGVKIMKVISRLAVTVVSCVGLSACITTRSYVDPQFHHVSYSQIARPAKPQVVRVDAQFERNGNPYPAVDGQLRQFVDQTLRGTGVFIPSPDVSNGAVVSVVANNIADISAARAKGFGTGLTFGAAGSVVPDYYHVTFTYRDPSGNEHKHSYDHAIYTTIGHATPPVDATPTTPALAFEKVIEDVTLNFVKDLQVEHAVSIK